MSPLRRDNMTVASRVMTPTYTLFFAAIALSLLATPQQRLRQTPAFAYADSLLDLRWWGMGYLAVAAFLAVALLIAHRGMYRGALSVGCVWMVGWGVLTAFAAFNGQTSFSAWIWPLFVAVACFATLRSLAEGER